MTRSSNTSNAPATIVLKTLHDDIVKANPTTTLTTKKMRVVLREKMKEVHAKNSSWVFNPTTYDQARSLFDASYAQKVAKKAKAAAKPAKARKAKVVVETKVEEVAPE